jgi:hypothetical protein
VIVSHSWVSEGCETGLEVTFSFPWQLQESGGKVSIKCFTSHVFCWWQKSISQWHLLKKNCLDVRTVSIIQFEKMTLLYICVNYLPSIAVQLVSFSQLYCRCRDYR